MKRKHAFIIVALLIVGIAVWHVAEKRLDLACYRVQQGSIYLTASGQGYATDEAIREQIWQDTVDEFYGQAWRASLDRFVHETFLGGSRADRVIRQVHLPVGPYADFSCHGVIAWSIYDKRNGETIRKDSFFTGVETMHEISLALDDIPRDELDHFLVIAESVLNKTTGDDSGRTSVDRIRALGEVSAKAWLRGEYVPEPWSSWYLAWREDNLER